MSVLIFLLLFLKPHAKWDLQPQFQSSKRRKLNNLHFITTTSAEIGWEHLTGERPHACRQLSEETVSLWTLLRVSFDNFCSLGLMTDVYQRFDGTSRSQLAPQERSMLRRSAPVMNLCGFWTHVAVNSDSFVLQLMVTDRWG